MQQLTQSVKLVLIALLTLRKQVTVLAQMTLSVLIVLNLVLVQIGPKFTLQIVGLKRDFMDLLYLEINYGLLQGIVPPLLNNMGYLIIFIKLQMAQVGHKLLMNLVFCQERA